MTNNLRRKAFFAAVILAFSVSVGGCGNKADISSENVELKYVMSGPGMQADCDMVWKVFNEKLSEKVPGVTINFEIIPVGDYNQKFLLMNSAREKIDIAGNYPLNFHAEVRNGTFLPLDDLLEKYGQETLKALPKWFMEYQKVDGITYGIPSYQMCAILRGVIFFKEQADKYLDIEAFKEAFYKTPHYNREMYEILEKYMDDMAADGIKFNGSVKTFSQRSYETITGPYAIEYGDTEGKVINYAFSEDFKLHYEISRRWKEKGYIKEDMLTNSANLRGRIDGIPFWDDGYTPYIQDKLSGDYGEELIVIPYYQKDYIGYKNSAGGTSIMEDCEEPVKAMKVINLLQSDKELYNLLVFGIEGVHYEKIGEDRIKTPYSLQAGSRDNYGLFKWVVGNTQLAYNTPSEPGDYKKWVFEESNMSDYRSPLLGFDFDVLPVFDYITQINYIDEKYFEPLLSGAFPDWEAAYNEYYEQANAVGNQIIIDEIQRQVDEFLAKKKSK